MSVRVYLFAAFGEIVSSFTIPIVLIRFFGQFIELMIKSIFYFVNDKFFKIYLFNSCDRELPNGTAIGINMNPAMELDPELTYDDWEKDYQSPERILT